MSFLKGLSFDLAGLSALASQSFKTVKEASGAAAGVLASSAGSVAGSVADVAGKLLASNDALKSAMVYGNVAVATSDGRVSEVETEQAFDIMRQRAEFKDLDATDFRAAWDTAAKDFALGRRIGMAKALGAVGKFKSDGSAEGNAAAGLLMAEFLSVADKDGEMTAEEKDTLTQLAQALGLDPRQFGLPNITMADAVEQMPRVQSAPPA